MLVQRHRWRGIQRSESARMLNIHKPSMQPRQNSHPSLHQQTSEYSSSNSSLVDRSLDSPNKLASGRNKATEIF